MMLDLLQVSSTHLCHDGDKVKKEFEGDKGVVSQSSSLSIKLGVAQIYSCRSLYDTGILSTFSDFAPHILFFSFCVSQKTFIHISD